MVRVRAWARSIIWVARRTSQMMEHLVPVFSCRTDPYRRELLVLRAMPQESHPAHLLRSNAGSVGRTSGKAGRVLAGRARGHRYAKPTGCRLGHPANFARVYHDRRPGEQVRESAVRALPTVRWSDPFSSSSRTERAVLWLPCYILCDVAS